MISPIFSMSFCFTSPVEYAMALGGVEIGRHMALDADKAIPMMIVLVPPIEPSKSPIPVHTTASIGTRSAAVAVCEMKFAMM